MISTDMTISLATWALHIEKQRATVSAQNIASASSGGLKMTGDFDSLISQMSEAVKAGRTQEIERLIKSDSTTTKSTSVPSSAISLDEEIITMSQAKGRYNVISEALAKKYALMTLSVGSK